MPEFAIKCQWEEEPGVADPVLARSWAQVEIVVEDDPITRFLSLRSNSVKEAVYGSVFPLAEWVVDNWWFLLHEGARKLAIMRGGRSAMRSDESLRFWLRRHNLLTAREGFALPDLSLFRDGSRIHLCWTSDPADDFPRRGRFLSTGERRISVEGCRSALGEFVQVVLERCDRIESEDVARLRSQWLAIQESDADDVDRIACAGLAALGLHPFSAEADDEQLRAALATMPRLSLPVQQDLLDATSPEHLGEDIGVVVQWFEASQGEGVSGPWRSVADIPAARDRLAFEAGYLRAQRIRDALKIGPERPLDDLAGMIDKEFGCFVQLDVRGGATTKRIDGAVIHQHDLGRRSLVGPSRSDLGSRFRLARALHQWLFAPASQGLLTRSQAGWDQRASRAFAAELLAPATGIRTVLAEDDDGWIGRAARKYRVDDEVILRQVQNNSIEWI